MPVSAVALVALFSAAVQLEGATSCPRPDLVADRLTRLLSAEGARQQRPDRARLWEQDGDLVVLLERWDGVLIGTRRFPRTYACEDLAYAAAVSLADWESDVHPEFAPNVIARANPASVFAAAPLPPPPAPGRWKLNAGAAVALGGSLDTPAAAGGAVVGAWLTPSDGRRVSLRAEMEGQSTRQIALEYGDAAWRRWTLGVGVERSFLASPENGGGWFRWFALVRLAWLEMHGKGFTLNRSDGTFDPGAAVGTRAVLARGRWTSWLELAASWWPVRQTVQANGVGDVGRLPAVEAFVRFGLGLGSAR